MHTIALLVDASLPSRAIALVMQEHGANRWQPSLNTLRLGERFVGLRS